jgi:hypothetical protein
MVGRSPGHIYGTMPPSLDGLKKTTKTQVIVGACWKRTDIFGVISHPDFRVKLCAYGHSVATLLNPRGVTTVSHKYSSDICKTFNCGSSCSFYRVLPF